MSPETKACIEKMKAGFMYGSIVGVVFGAFVGGLEANRFRHIPGSQKVGLAVRGSLAGAIGFGFFVAVGSTIRSCGTQTR